MTRSLQTDHSKRNIVLVAFLFLIAGCGDGDPPLDPGPRVTSDSLMALTEVSEDRTEAAADIVSNTGFHTIYSLEVDVQPGDVLRVRSQVEMSNDDLDAGSGCTLVRGHTKLLVNGRDVGTVARQNNVCDPVYPYAHHMHHMPLWADAAVEMSTQGKILVEAQYATSRSGASPRVRIEDGYGHLVVEKYRMFASREDAADAGAYGLVRALTNDTEEVSTFGQSPGVGAVVYHLDAPVEAGDIVRLFGQVASRHDEEERELHAQGIFVDGGRASPWTTENNVKALPNLPLWSDCVVEPTAAGDQIYELKVHGLYGITTGIANGGFLSALHFGVLGIANPHAKAMVDWQEWRGPTGPVNVTANSGWRTLLSRKLTVKSRDVIHLVGFAQLVGPDDYDKGISCRLRLDVSGADSRANESAKYVTPLLEVLPLRNEVVMECIDSGSLSVKLMVSCTRSNENPTIEVEGGSAVVLVERFEER